MSQIVILGQFDIDPADAENAARLMTVMMNETAKEQGCLHYAYSRDLSTPNRFQLSELWTDGEALEAHFKTEHMANYRAGMKEVRVQKRTVTRYEVANAKPL
jgi:quinol monooxygenase YgiN